MSKSFTYTFLLLCLLSAVKVHAQTKPDSSLTESEQSAINLYNRSIGDRSGIYRGPAVVPYTLRSSGTPNFRDTTDYFENGTVNYDHRIYYHVPLIYNIERDKLESRINGTNSYTLLSDKVSDFDLLGRHFINITNSGTDKVAPGFYEVIYNGKIQVLARHVKTLQMQTTAGRVAINTFSAQTTYFLKKGNTYYAVDSKSRFLNALADKKKEIQQYLKDTKMDFSENQARVMNVLAAYYDRLTN